MKRILSSILLLSLFVNLSLFAQKQGISCGVNDKNLPEKTLNAMRMAPVWLAEKQSRKAVNDFYVCRIAIDIDSDTYNYFEKDTARIKYEVLKTIERVSKVYEKEINTQLVVTHINIRKDRKTDPYYGTSDIFDLLDIAYDLWKRAPFKNLPFDKVMYLPTKPFKGAGGVAMDFVNVSPFGDFMVIAHELGHNFGSPHTQSCDWPGGAIDFCYPTEGDCYQNSIEYIKGTIMSYCQEKLTFHPLCQILMQKGAETYLKKLTKLNSAPVLVDTIRHDSNPFILFNPSVSAEDYYYEVSQTVDFSQIVLADSSFINAVPFPTFKKNTAYYLRIKARNRLGISAWSNTATIVIPNNILLPPVLKAPENSVKQNKNLFLGDFDQYHTLPFELDKDATQYEIAIYDQYDIFHSLKEVTYSIKNNSTDKFTFRPFDYWLFNNFSWRVRAINGNTKGAWSELQRVDCLQKENMIEFPVYRLVYETDGDMPPDFPLFYRGNDESYDVKFTISANSDFSNPVTEKLVKTNKYFVDSYSDYSIMSGKLSPDTEYYLKVETIPPTPDYTYEKSGAVFRTIIKKFRTGSSNTENQYKILTNDNTPNLGRTLKTVLPGGKGVFVKSEQGFSRVDIHKLTADMFDRDNTNGAISNTSGFISTDSLGNLWTIGPLSKRSAGYDGAFPKAVYALRKFDKNNMALLSSLEFVIGDGIFGNFKSIDADNQLIITDYQIGKIEGGVLNTYADFGAQFLITDVVSSKSYIWVTGVDYAQSKLVLRRYNRITKDIEYVTYGSDYNIMEIAVDKDENLWLKINEISGLVKYDGNNWTIYDSSNSPLPKIGHSYSLATDNFNNLYVAMQIDNRVFQFNGKEWRVLDDFSKIGLENIEVDQSGKIWSILKSNILVHFDPCEQISKPSIINNSTTLALEKPMILEAKGCNSVVWNWESKTENVYEKLVSGTNKIEIRPKSTTTYRARCYDNGCSGEEDVFILSFNVLSANKVVKNQICQGDSILIAPEVEGEFEINNQFSALLTSGQKNFKITLDKTKDGFKFKTDNSLLVGKYWLKLASSFPEIVSRDSIEIEILPLPTVSIVGKINICPGEGISIFAAAKNGMAPYIYNWKRGSFSDSSPDSVIRGIDVPTVFNVQVKDSKGCVSNTANHVITKSSFSNFKISVSGYTDLIDNATVMFSVPLVTTYTYQWFKDNQAIQGAINNSFTAKQAGKYHVVASEKDCQAISDAITVSVITANEPIETEDLALKVFPNPSDGNFVFEFTLTDNKPTELNIFDISGKTIWQKSIKGRGVHSEQVNLSKYTTGTYLLVMQKDGLKRTVKLEKQ